MIPLKILNVFSFGLFAFKSLFQGDSGGVRLLFVRRIAVLFGSGNMAIFILALTGGLMQCRLGAQDIKQDGLGISSWASWTGINQILPADNPHLRTVPLIVKWKFLEPTPGGYDWQKQIGDRLELAEQNGLYVMIKIYVGPDSPAWIYDNGLVPKVYTTGGPFSEFPYYFDEDYKNLYFGLIDALKVYLDGLPESRRERILYIQSAEGSTGDGYCYKGELTQASKDAEHEITREEWDVFRLEAFEKYQTTFPDMPILVNADANEVEEDNWLVENMLMIGTKQGFFSHGYQINHGIEFLDKFRALEAKARAHNPPLEVFTRGEMDAEILDFAWGTNNLEQALYWSGLYATHCQLDSWNVRSDLLRDPIHFETCEFFNRYAGLHRAENSPRAVIALRDGLDSADLTRFPEGQYGTGVATRGNLSRYQDIIAAFSGRGARLDDTVAVTKSAFASRRTDGYNDVGWKIIPGNFERFITQINPLSGDKGWWNVDVVKKGSPLGQASKYSRFARGFEGAGGGMYFDIADDLADNLHPNRSLVKVRIIYFDEHAGSTWQLRYDSGATGMKVRNFTNTGGLEWKEVVVTLIDADFQGNGTFGADIELLNTDADEDIFHRIEIEYPSINVSTGSDLDVLLDATLYDGESDPADATVIEDLGDRVGSIKNASWVRYDRVDLGTGAPAFEVSVSSASSGGTIDVWFGDFEAGQGGVISTVHTVGTGSWSNFQTFSASVSGGVGIDDLYLVFSGSEGDLFELQSFKFSTSGSGSPGSVSLSSSVSGSDVTLTASASDPDGVASVNFYDGAGNLVGADTTSPYVATVAGLPDGEHTFSCELVDALGDSVFSGPVTATVDTAPWVTISATVLGSDVLLSADGWDPDGITRIGFYYDDGTFIKNDATVPYEHTVAGLAPGPYSFKARLVDGNLDNSLYSSPAVVNVGGSPGSVSLSSSVSGSDVTLTASASDPDGVASVNFYDGAGNLVATDTTSPYVATVAGLPDGEHTFTCELVDAFGDSVFSGPVTATVSAAPASKELTRTEGDVDGDGALAPSDLVAMRALIGTGGGDPGYDAAADLDGDGLITRNDYRLLYVLLRSASSDS